MTTEIAVINRLGIALAADSAVTIPGYGGDKVFDTGDKLFELSELHPVALMVNGSMDFLGVPWELIAKEFRCQVPDGAPDISIAEWMARFLDFVSHHQAVKPDDVRRWTLQLIREESDALSARVREALEQSTADANQGNLQQVRRDLYQRDMVESLDALQKEDLIESLHGVEEDDLLAPLRSEIAELDPPLPFADDAELVALFVRVIAQRLLKGLDRDTTTGLIVGGFGNKDMFPSLYAVEIDGWVAQKLRYRKSHDVTIDRGKETGNAISFAQTDVVERLLKGADNRFINKARDFIRENVAGSQDLLERLGLQLKVVRQNGEELDSAGIAALLGDLIAANFESQFVVNLTREFEQQFKDTIALMPKQDLIELAEALVSITAIERRASDDAGTVGGPIDVALITRAEGFVWVKRKHFFDPALNPRFLWRRFSRPVATETANAPKAK